MYTRLAIVSVLAGVGLTSTNNWAQQAMVEQKPAGLKEAAIAAAPQRNAALMYYQAWEACPLPELRKLTFDVADPNWQPSADLVELLKNNQDHIAALLRASSLEVCDFEIDGKEGPGVLLPHLSLFRASSRCLAADARRCINEGKQYEAAERVAAIYRMAEHLGQDGDMLISGLVAVSLCELADALTDLLISTNNLTISGQGIVLAAGKELAKPDAYGLKAALMNERDDSYGPAGWYRMRWQGDDAGKQFVEEMSKCFGLEQADIAFPEVQRMNTAQLEAEFDKVERIYTDMLAVWDDADVMEKLKAVGDACENGEYGLLAKWLAPSVVACKKSELRQMTRHANILDRLTSAVVPQH